MKKTLSSILVFALVLTMLVPAFAFAADKTPAQMIEELNAKYENLFQGDQNGNLDLEGKVQRDALAKILATVAGLEVVPPAADAEPMFSDVADNWAYLQGYLGAAYKAGYLNGVGEGKFNPRGDVNYAMLATVIARVLDVEVVGATPWYAGNLAAVQALGFMTDVTVEGANEVAPRSALVFAAYVADQNLEPEAPAVVAVNVTSATAINSKVVEVSLKDAATAIDGSVFAVTKADGTAIAVVSAEFSPWSSNGKSVLVTLANDTVAGTLYTVASGDTKANFGGIAKDTVKPTVVAVTSTDYNEVSVEFSEPIKAETVVFASTEKYGTKADLAPVFKGYSSSSVLLYSTADQKAATLYGTSVSDAVDFAGNAMNKDEAKTFVGQAMPTAKQGLNSVTVVDSLTLEVKFDVKVDEASALNVANYAIAEKYGSKTVLPVVAAEMNTTNTGVVIPTEVVLTLGADTKGATLYELKVQNIGTLYGKELDSNDATTTFVGVDRDTKVPSGVSAVSDSNTQITVSFTDVNGADALAEDADHSLVTVTEKYGNKEALTLTFKEIDGNTMVFTTSAQKAATLYEIKVAKGIKDKLGNVSTADLTNTFVGSGVAAKITSVAVVQDNTATTGKVRIQFNQNYGAGALDVASYFIDNGVGYPTKVSKVTGAADQVDLSIPKTTTGKLYKLTVKGVANADGVAMDANGITATFVGTGGAAVSVPRFEAAVALNDQTMILYFDTNVKDITALYSATPGTMALEIGLTGANVANPTHAFVDPSNPKAIIAYTTTANGFEATGAATTVTVDIPNATSGLDSDYDQQPMAENTSAPTAIKVDGVVAVNDTTLNVYFNQTVRHLGNAFATVTKDGTPGTFATVTNARALNSTSTLWEVSLSQALTNHSFKLELAAYNAANISVVASGVNFVGLDTTTSYAFAGNPTADPFVKDVYAVALDKRTVQVFFPEDMNTADVANATYYTVWSATSSGTNLTNSKIRLAQWDAATKSVKLTTNGDFNVSGTGNYFLHVDSAVKNALGTKTVKASATADLYSQFALSTAPAAEVKVSSVSVSGQAITVKFNQRFTTAADVTDDAAELLKYLKITVNGSTVLTAGNIADVGAKLGTGAEVNSQANFVDTLVITVGGGLPLTANGQGTVELVGTAAATGINGEAQDTDMAPFIFVQK